MTFPKGSANRPVHAQMVEILGPERNPHPADAVKFSDRELDHIMRCKRVGCTRCA